MAMPGHENKASNITALGTTFFKFAQLSVPSCSASLQAPISATAVFPPSPPELVPLASIVAEHKPQKDVTRLMTGQGW